jgi:hypothetical protein
MLIGFFAPFVTVIVLDYIDQSLRTPSRAQRIIGLNLLGAFPNMSERNLRNDRFDWDKMSGMAVGLLCQNLLLELKKLNIQEKKPKLICAFSTEASDGKSRVTHEMSNELALLGFNTAVLRYKLNKADDETLYDEFVFPIDRAFLNTFTPQQLIKSGEDLKVYDFVFLEIPALLQSRYPVDLLEGMDVALMTTRASRVWRKADAHALHEVMKVLRVQPRVVLNGVEPEDMEEVIGEVAQSSTPFQRFVKKLINFEFSTRKGFSSKQPLF